MTLCSIDVTHGEALTRCHWCGLYRCPNCSFTDRNGCGTCGKPLIEWFKSSVVYVAPEPCEHEVRDILSICRTCGDGIVLEEGLRRDDRG